MSRRSEFSPDPGLTNKEFGVDLQETAQPLTIAGFQTLIAEMYSQKDAARGIDGTFMWLMEEVGELAGALRQGSREDLAAEFADVLAWLVTIANVAEIDLEQAVLAKYGRGCPGCGQMVCRCDLGEKP
jgi:NTP pyrophosphatase (non-canonical NTP hydrolase)